MVVGGSTLSCCCGGLQLFGELPIVLQSTSTSSTRRKQPSISRCGRRFAHTSNSYPLESEPDLSWPTTPTFSPYDIFKLSKAECYSKRRYYDLVKLYHPDLQNKDHPLFKNVPESIRLHRYRLIVAAHEILSDPAKREAYDRNGHGWHHRSELFAQKAPRRMDVRYERGMGGDDSIYRNATWEDWERWHRRHDRNQSQASTVSHGTFASFLILLMLFGGVGQAVSIGNYSSHVADRARESHEKCAKFLHSRRQQTIAQVDSLDSGLQSFLIRRDPYGYGLKEEEEETYRKVLSPNNKSHALHAIETPSPPPEKPPEIAKG
ncbi:conserved hypothetical protein [Histoplasma capsulatum G186AR]|uniref:J domain-containing protein n=1 Tax=Ajellomyces capsulatus (strain G186AR / H82 / ATCC MYA-2454 / RMSCC 2432) TaxID=447093 RepID=C0NUZ9_AJECG|nr:uncharacterized protein HCBG_06763 [Histoplasma capsulatum G186AR]EEH04812.1 conserved hypothetical protein [Histoplasma capsulatum G186AR]